MEINEIKSIWNDLQRNIEENKKFSQEILNGVIREKSKGGLERIKRSLSISIVYTAVFLIFIALVFIGNPFDYQYKISYLPAILYAVLAVFTLTILIKEYTFVRSVTLYKENLLDTLKLVIKSREKFKRTGLLILVNSFFIALTFGISLTWRTPQEFNVEKILIVIGISLVSAFGAWGLGKYFDVFKGKGLQQLHDSLKEMEEEKLV